MKARVQTTGTPMLRQRRDDGQVRLSTFIPWKIKKLGARTVVLWPDGAAEVPGTTARTLDQPLLVALARAFYWQHLLDEGVVASGSEIARREGLHHSTVNELLRLTLLEPALIQAILAGKQPRCMSLLWFQRNPLPTEWAAQREVVAGFDA
ncbi:MAG: site-specific recombinase resolvase [Azonexus sp.]